MYIFFFKIRKIIPLLIIYRNFYFSFIFIFLQTLESNIEKYRAFLRGSRECQNSARAWFLCVITRTEDFSAGGLSRRMDNRRRKEFFTLLFLTPGALRRRKSAERKARRVWPRAGHGWVILISGLHTPLGRLDDYFGSGAGQYLDNTLTGGFVRSVSTTTHRVTLFILSRFPTPSHPRARSRSNISERFQTLISTVVAVHFDVTNVRAQSY